MRSSPQIRVASGKGGTSAGNCHLSVFFKFLSRKPQTEQWPSVHGQLLCDGQSFRVKSLSKVIRLSKIMDVKKMSVYCRNRNNKGGDDSRHFYSDYQSNIFIFEGNELLVNSHLFTGIVLFLERFYFHSKFPFFKLSTFTLHDTSHAPTENNISN